MAFGFFECGDGLRLGHVVCKHLAELFLRGIKVNKIMPQRVVGIEGDECEFISHPLQRHSRAGGNPLQLQILTFDGSPPARG